MHATTARRSRGGWALLAVLAALVATLGPAQARTLNIVALGDSLTAGYMLPDADAFPTVLQAALRKDDFDVAVANAGVSGDTTAGGLERLDWSVPDGTDGVILELGANDMLRGLDPAIPRRNLATMITRLKARHIPVFLAGMRANPSLGADYVKTFDAIYPDLAAAENLPLDPFFLDGVTGQPQRQLADGLHPNADGVRIIVQRMLPALETWLKGLTPK